MVPDRLHFFSVSVLATGVFCALVIGVDEVGPPLKQSIQKALGHTNMVTVERLSGLPAYGMPLKLFPLPGKRLGAKALS
jgi:hypothetical protein